MTRTEALCRVLGWQGGTVHQVAAETGLTVEQILYSSATDTSLASKYTGGWFAARTCGLEHNRAKVFPQHKGDLDFWIGAADGMIQKANGV